jgi:pterin-4a-carbinolamine dehydratase
MNKETKEAFLKDLKEICQKHQVSFTTANQILHRNSFFPTYEKLKIEARTRRSSSLNAKALKMAKFIEEVNRVNKSNYIAII